MEGCSSDESTHFQQSNTDDQALQISFGNGQWLPVIPELESELYWWSFPWTRYMYSKDAGRMPDSKDNLIWKLIAGNSITHLPQHCIRAMTTYLSCEVLHHRRLTPQIVDFGPEYESVLESFTAHMLGIFDDVPPQKFGLLTKLLNYVGFNPTASADVHEQHIATTHPKLDVSLRVQDVPFDNGQWIPVIPEPQEHVYWWTFPWRYRRTGRPRMQCPLHKETWKLVAGNSITHLPADCLTMMTPKLESAYIYPKTIAPQIIEFSPEYEAVLPYFTERMLGIDDYIPQEKQGLLNKLFDESGYLRGLPLYDRFGNLVPEKYPI